MYKIQTCINFTHNNLFLASRPSGEKVFIKFSLNNVLYVNMKKNAYYMIFF